MDNVFLVNVFESCYKTCHKEAGSFLVEAPVLANVVTQVAAGEIVHHQVKVFAVLKGVVHVDDEQIIELFQNLPLVDYRLHTTLGNYASLGHFFHSIVLFFFLSFDSPDFSKSALADAEMVDEVGLRDSYTALSAVVLTMETGNINVVCPEVCVSHFELNRKPILIKHTTEQ